MEEIWKPIKFNNNYQISNLGNLKSLKYRNQDKEQYLTCYGKEYKLVRLKMGNKRKDFYIHRLVAEHFIPNPKNLNCINHINGNKKDNRVENLEWCTYQHNIKEAFRLGLSFNKTGSGNGKSKPVKQFDNKNNLIKEWESMRLAEQELHIRHIAECCKGKRKKAGGYIWVYA